MLVPTGSLREQSEPTGVQDNSLVSTGSLTKQSKPIGSKTRITGVGPQKGCYCRYGNVGGDKS